MELSYYILGEVTVCFLSILLCFNILVTFSPYERTHRLFLYSAVSSVLSTFFDIITVFSITYYDKWPVFAAYIVNHLYFSFLLAVPFFLSLYAYTLTYVNHKSRILGYGAPICVYSIYILLLFISLKTGWIFSFDNVNGYVKGPFVSLTYVCAFILIVLTFFYGLLNRKYIAKRLLVVLLIYPVISLGIILIQFFFPKVLLSGLSSFSALLFCYLTVQSDMLSVDFQTGLFSSHQFQKNIVLKKNKGFLFVIEIHNLDFIENHIQDFQYNNLLVKIGKKIKKEFGFYSYHISENKFATVVKSQEDLQSKYQEMKSFLENIFFDTEFDIPVPFESFFVAMEFYAGEKNYNNMAEIINNLLEKAIKTNDKKLSVCNECVLEEMEYQRFIFDVLKRELTLDSEQFQVYYQPIYSIQEGKLVYMEALSRLKSYERGFISPLDFIAVAEKKGLIEKLGEIAFEKVCKFISENRDLVNAVSVNFSVYQISSPSVVDKVLSVIQKYNLSTSNIIIEITESVFIDNFNDIFKNINALVKAGIKFYLDDFGTGYSNLANVIALPFSTVKMDRSLVQKMEENERNFKLVKNLISTFKDSNLDVLVEGVETEKQDSIVKSSGVDYIQGYLYSKPIPEKECIKILKEQSKQSNFVPHV